MNLVYPPCYPVCSCEPYMAGLILQPWAFWTSLLYLPAIYFVAKKNPNTSRSWISGIILVTIASLLAHASFDKLTLAFDEAAVVLVLLSYHLNEKTWARAIGLNILLIAIFATVFFSLPFDVWVPLVFVLFLFSGYLAYRKLGGKAFLDREFLVSIAIYAASFALFAYDKHPLLCKAEFLPYGHPAWHAGAAVTTYLFADWWFRKGPRKIQGP